MIIKIKIIIKIYKNVFSLNLVIVSYSFCDCDLVIFVKNKSRFLKNLFYAFACRTSVFQSGKRIFPSLTFSRKTKIYKVFIHNC